MTAKQPNPPPPRCMRPPPGWWCSREPGHSGPCAARPAPTSPPVPKSPPPNHGGNTNLPSAPPPISFLEFADRTISRAYQMLNVPPEFYQESNSNYSQGISVRPQVIRPNADSESP